VPIVGLLTEIREERGCKVPKIEDLGEVISADVLIVGGGIGGLTAAIKAKEESSDVDVLIVEKQTVGWAGKATKVGAGISLLGPRDDASKFVEWQVRNSGYYLNEQELLNRYVLESRGSVEELLRWGVTISTDATGGISAKPHFWAPNLSLAGIDIDMQLPLRRKARKMGARILNKVQVVDLLKQGERVIGAVGFNIIDGRFYIFKSKATILANGSCNYKVRRYFSCGTGEGIAAAYRAGAEMRNAEYGNLYAHIVFKDVDSGMVEPNLVVNASGDNLSERYAPGEGHTGVFLSLAKILGMEKEVAEGRGPLYMDLAGGEATLPPAVPQVIAGWNLPKAKEWHQALADKEHKYGAPPSAKREVEVPLHGELSCVKVDQQMKTTLDGLFAIGDCSYGGSALAGAVAAPPGVTPGSGLGYAILSARWGGPPAARYAKKAASAEASSDGVKRLKEEIFAPMKRAKGLLPGDAISAIQDVVSPIKYNLRRSKDRLEEAISRMKEVQERLPELHAKDGHGLGKCHEARAMAICAEITFRSALMRTESRGMHYREDYPERDDKNWLKWVVARQEAGKMVLSTEPIPIDKYKIKP
jgi:succinate dehydrogenase / fumarate reductase flavoprotein subunit